IRRNRGVGKLTVGSRTGCDNETDACWVDVCGHVFDLTAPMGFWYGSAKDHDYRAVLKGRSALSFIERSCMLHERPTSWTKEIDQIVAKTTTASLVEEQAA